MMKKALYIALFSFCSMAFALQGGPIQPDYLQFEPSDKTEMVNLKTGDFVYSIPLGDVPSAYGNYPLSISYHAGISPQQEATWVGLGWTLNPGSIIRDVRGVPDDQFGGGTLGFVYQYSALITWNCDFTYSNGVFSVGVSANSNRDVGVNLTLGKKIGNFISVGLTVDSRTGVGFVGQVGYDNVGFTVGAMYSVRDKKWLYNGGINAGNDNVSLSLKAQYASGSDVAYDVGMSWTSKNLKSQSIFSVSGGNSGTSFSLGPVSTGVATSTTNGNSGASSINLGVVVPTKIGTFAFSFTQTRHSFVMSTSTSDYVYGYMYQGGPAIAYDKDNNVDGIPYTETGFVENWWAKGDGRVLKGRTLESIGENNKSPAYDIFSVASEGVSGSFRAFPRESHQLYTLTSNYTLEDDDRVESYSPMINLNDERWPENDVFVYSLATKKRESTEYSSYKTQNNVDAAFAKYKTQFRNEGNRMVYRANKNDNTPFYSGISFLFMGEGGYYESDCIGCTKKYESNQVSDKLLKRSFDEENGNKREYALYGSRKIEPIFEKDSPIGKIEGFVITNSDGSKYFFTQPVKSYLKVDYSINQEKGNPTLDDGTLSKTTEIFKNILIGYGLVTDPIVTFAFGSLFNLKGESIVTKCKEDEADKNKIYTYLLNFNPHATQWLITEIQGPDFVQLDENDISKNLGFNVKFHYSEPSLYHWRSPFAPPDTKASELPNFRMSRNGLTPAGCDTKMYQASFGIKEYVYLKSIETATHEAVFELNDPKKEERVDGKGWLYKGENAADMLPVFMPATLSLKINSIDKLAEQWKNESVNKAKLNGIPFDENLLENLYEGKYEYDAIYVNVDILDFMKKHLKKNHELILVSNYGYTNFKLQNEDGISSQYNSFFLGQDEFVINVDENVVVEPTSGEESKYGLYKIKINDAKKRKFYWLLKKNDEVYKNASSGNLKIILGEKSEAIVENKNAINRSVGLTYCYARDYKKVKETNDYFGYKFEDCSESEKILSPYLSVGNILFSNDVKDAAVDQMRYLKKISYYKKKDAKPYREYIFNYDYSLHPKTLNSYCSNLEYPKSLDEIKASPLTAELNVCSSEENKSYLYGRLSLKSITEKGCQNDRCVSLPPFKFDYSLPSQSSTRYSSKDEWIDAAKQNKPKYIVTEDGSRTSFYSQDYFDEIDDVAASIRASENTIDEWGFWNVYANVENHKVDQSFADYGAAAWSINKITDPAGGVMEIEYERDVYQNGEDHSDEKLYVPMVEVGACKDYSDYFMHEYGDETCALFLPMYWKDQCLGPRLAQWDYSKPKGYSGGDFDYMNEFGLIKNGNINKDTTVFFNIHTMIKTEVDCGWWGLSECDRNRNVGLLGNTNFIAMYEKERKISELDIPKNLKKILEDNSTDGKHVNTRLLVMNKHFTDIFAGYQVAADKIDDEKNWKFVDAEGVMWIKKSYESMKGGNLRVKKLARYDLDHISKTEYEYYPGEMAQLPDSAYTSVMGNRFNADMQSVAMPDLKLMPMSRIVGIDEDDLQYLPVSQVLYPKVIAKNSDNGGKIPNGKTELDFITPEKGVPAEYIDEETKKNLLPFIHVNAKIMVWGEYDDDYSKRPIGLTFEFLGGEFGELDASMNYMLMPNAINSFNFYNEKVKYVKMIKIFYKKKEIGIINLDELTDFNDVALTISYIKKEFSVHKNWQRSQKKGYYPILYKEISYRTEKIKFLNLKGFDEFFNEYQTMDALFEDKVVFHDFVAFLGMNTKISYYRGNGNDMILTSVDSSVYSTQVPDVFSGVADNKDDVVEENLGKQVERWNSTRELQCIYDKKEDEKEPDPNSFGAQERDVVADKDKKRILCEENDISLSARSRDVIDLKENDDERLEYFMDDVSFEYKRYSVFKVASISQTGYDNQELQFISSSSNNESSSSVNEKEEHNKKLWISTEIQNHRYNPITGLPTAILSKIKVAEDKEQRKLTHQIPHHATFDENLNSTPLARFMFEKNMLSQSYADFVYFDSKPFDIAIDSRKNDWKKLEKIDYLQKISINPIKKYTKLLAKSSSSSVDDYESPYVDMGTFTSKEFPKKILDNASVSDGSQYTYIARYQDVRPSVESSDIWLNAKEFNGNHILLVDRYFRPIETENELGRKQSTHYSDDGLYMSGLFYPASYNKTAAIVPIEDEVSVVNINSSFKKEELSVDMNEGGMVAQSSISFSNSIFDNDENLIVEYRVRKGSDWKTAREKFKSFKLNLEKGDVLNYLRIYPDDAEAKTFIYDKYGNLIQQVGEDNLSTYYEYDPLGKLVQIRNDDGVTFKNHHQEFRNDNRDDIPWSEILQSSSSK